jgi:hypothetical protein
MRHVSTRLKNSTCITVYLIYVEKTIKIKGERQINEKYMKARTERNLEVFAYATVFIFIFIIC